MLRSSLLNESTLKIIAVGDNCVDSYIELGRHFPGGNALNVAVYAGRLPGFDVVYCGIVGTDEAGEFLLSQIRKEGLSTENIIRFPGNTAVTTILIRGGDRVFADYLEGVQKDAILPDTMLPQLKSSELVHFTIWGWGREKIPDLYQGPKLSCDFSNQFDHPALETMRWLDYNFFSGRELILKDINPEDKLRELKRKTNGLVIMTLGEHGSIAYDGKKIFKSSAYPVEVIDTLGAGDAYIAAFLCSNITGVSIPDAMKQGHLAAYDVCRRLGAWGGD